MNPNQQSQMNGFGNENGELGREHLRQKIQKGLDGQAQDESSKKVWSYRRKAEEDKKKIEKLELKIDEMTEDKVKTENAYKQAAKDGKLSEAKYLDEWKKNQVLSATNQDLGIQLARARLIIIEQQNKMESQEYDYKQKIRGTENELNLRTGEAREQEWERELGSLTADERVKAEQEIQARDKEIASLKEQLREQHSSMTAKIDELTSEKKTVDAKLVEAELKVIETKKRSNDWIEELEKRVAKFENRVAELTQEAKLHTEHLRNSETSWLEKNEEIGRNLAQSEDSKNQLEDEVRQMTTKMEGLQTFVSKLEEENGNLQSRLSEYEVCVAQLREENARMRNRILAATNLLNGTSDEDANGMAAKAMETPDGAQNGSKKRKRNGEDGTNGL